MEAMGKKLGEGGTHACNCTAMEDAETVLTRASVSGGGLEEGGRQVLGTIVQCAPSGFRARS